MMKMDLLPRKLQMRCHSWNMVTTGNQREQFYRGYHKLHNTYAYFKNYSCEKVTKMANLEIFLILFPVDYLKDELTPQKNLLKHPMEPWKCIQWIGCWFYMGCWVRIVTRRNGWATSEPKIYEGAPFRLNKYMSRMSFECIISSIRYTYRKDVEYNY